MRLSTLLRIGGTAAILAGVLRAASSFASGGSEGERQALYFIVDLLLLLGAFAAYAQHHEAVGRWGAAGVLTTVAGILLVRSSRTVPGLDLYPAAALSVAIGWVLLSLAWWRTANGPAFVPVLFALSIVTGLVGQIVSRESLFVASGVIFGAAVAGTGRQVLLGVSTASRNQASPAPSIRDRDSESSSGCCPSMGASRRAEDLAMLRGINAGWSRTPIGASTEPHSGRLPLSHRMRKTPPCQGPRKSGQSQYRATRAGRLPNVGAARRKG